MNGIVVNLDINEIVVNLDDYHFLSQLAMTLQHQWISGCLAWNHPIGCHI
jgi:hypothetical protein